MNVPKTLKLGLLGLSVIPFLGSTCVEEKTIELALTGSTTAGFLARGSDNTDFGTDCYDVKADLDLTKLFADNDIDASDILRIRFKGLEYRITKAQANRNITSGDLTVEFGDACPFTPVAPALLVSGFSGSAAAVTDWIDVTPLLQTPGVNAMNAFLARCLAELQGGAPAANTAGQFDWSGVSIPDTATDFDWEAKLKVSIVYGVTGDFPDF
jgi:hypothetical protein